MAYYREFHHLRNTNLRLSEQILPLFCIHKAKWAACGFSFTFFLLQDMVFLHVCIPIDCTDCRMCLVSVYSPFCVSINFCVVDRVLFSECNVQNYLPLPWTSPVNVHISMQFSLHSVVSTQNQLELVYLWFLDFWLHLQFCHSYSLSLKCSVVL